MAGCTTWQAAPLPPIHYDEQQRQIEEQQRQVQEQQRQITRLQQSLADKQAEINHLRTHQQDQVKELKETTTQAARAEVKLRRFATEADVASLLVEVEMAMEALVSALGTEREVPLQLLAQRLLDASSAAFKRDNKYSVAADLAAQAEQLINLLMNNLAPPNTRAAPEVPLKITIPLKIKVDSNLRRQPNTSAVVLGVLPKATPVVARAAQGQWLRVQTEDGNSGWVFGNFLEPR